jgi:flagellar basal-body rod protein FlgG
MINSFYIGATGMNAQQVFIDTIANNVANINTTAFKKGRVTFEDLFYQRLNGPALSTNRSGDDLTTNQVGLGSVVGRTDNVFTVGSLVQTNNQLDLAINGSGFLEVTDASGNRYYARAGSLQVDSDGNLQTLAGYNIAGQIRIPTDATSVTIGTDGKVSAVVSGQADPVQLGQIELANFVNTSGLQVLGGGLYTSTEASGQAYFAVPGDNGLGTLSQGYLESSNVDLNTELINLVTAQRAYQINSRIIQVSDDLLTSIISLRR